MTSHIRLTLTPFTPSEVCIGKAVAYQPASLVAYVRMSSKVFVKPLIHTAPSVGIAVKTYPANGFVLVSAVSSYT